MNTISTNFVTSQYYNNLSANQKKKIEGKKNSNETVKTSNSAGINGLSDKAKDILEKLKEKYSDMDFFVADYNSDEEASSILSRSNKEYSVLFTGEELEKMAEDEDYYKSVTEQIDNATTLSTSITEAFPEEAEDENSTTIFDIAKIGVAFKADGTAKYFASLEKMSEAQKERLKKAQEEKSEEAKNEEATAVPTKKTTIEADSIEELIEKIKAIDWSQIKEESTTVTGGKIDFSI